jgi:hypothetical protein
MVDLQRAIPLGGVSRRNIFLFATSFFVAIFAVLFATAPVVHAADATWQGSSISYAGKQFIKTADAGDNDPRGLVKGTQIYAYVEPDTSNPSNPTQKAHIIYFAPGADPPTATSATYVVYSYTPPATYSNASTPATISLDPQTAAAETTSCNLEGIGWIVCPATSFLAGAMDKLFEVLSGFLVVRPVQTSQENPLFRIWSVMRNFANVMFVIGFLIIIYAQVTSVGISNYGIKRILPRLIVAALLVNISYWICAIAIDVSNIAGNSLQQLFISLRDVLVVPGQENGWKTLNWQSVTGFVLSGGTAAVLAGIGAQALLGGTVTGSIFFLVPVLVTVLVAILVALLIMALRQALITILVIVSPLAFVAYLLPNTEKYFEKWRELFMTMLMMYPILSVIFGGSQLAGLAIIQNADSINLIILGMAVQVAPLIVTPLIIKFSGALLTRFSGMVNNPSKGLIDRTRNWAKDRSENQKAHVLGNPARAGWRGAATRRSQNIDSKRRKREATRAANQGLADARWANSQEYSDIQQINMRAAAAKDMGETRAQARFEASKYTNANMQQLEIDVRAAKLNLDLSKARVDANWDELTAGDARNMVVPEGLSVNGLANYAHNRRLQAQSILEQTTEMGVEKRRAHSAEHIRQSQFTQRMLTDDALRTRAGGIDPHGADSALANAVAEDRTAFSKSVEEAKHVLKHFNVNAEQREGLLDGNLIKGKDSSGFEREFTLHDTFATEAAIEIQMQEGSFIQKQKIIAESGEGNKLYAHRATIGDEASKNRIGDQAAYLGGAAIDLIKQGKIKGEEGLNEAAAYSLKSGKLKAEHLATMDHAAVKRILDVARNNVHPGFTGEALEDYNRNVKELGKLAEEALTNNSLRGRVARNALKHLKEMRDLWPPSDNDNS